MSYSSKNNNGIGCLALIAILLLVALVQSGMTYFNNNKIYQEAHAAYLAGDCSSASKGYDQIASKFSVFDFAKIRQKSDTESNDCYQFSAAVEAGIESLYTYKVKYPENPLLEFAGRETTRILENLDKSPELIPALERDNCLHEDLYSEESLLDETNTPLFEYLCSQYMAELGDSDSALAFISSLFSNYPDSPQADQIRDAFANETTYCSVVGEMDKLPEFKQHPNELANLYLNCGANYVEAEAFTLAADLYMAFVDKYPDHTKVPEINQLLPDLLIKAARAEGSGTIQRPDESGWAPAGVSRVVIQNDSPHTLRLVFSGPDARIEELPACSECTDYTGIGPLYCPEQGPIGSYDLTPGTFEVMVEAMDDDSISPFTGTWELDDSKEFYSCFFVVTTMY